MQKKIAINKIELFYWLIGIYFGLASVYWIGDNGFVESVRWIKILILAAIFIAIFVILSKDVVNKFLPTGYFGVGHFFIFIILSAPGFFQASNYEVAVKYFTNISIPYVFCWMIWIISENIKCDYELLYVYKGAKIVIPFFILIILSKFFGWPDWYNPYLKGIVSLADSGFGGTRTSWGVGAALVFPLIISGFLITENRTQNIINIIFLISGILAVAIPTSRSAMLAVSVDVIFLAMVVPRRKEYKILISLGMCLILIGFSVFFAQDLRLSGVDVDGNSVDISSGRGAALDYGLSLLMDKTFLGYGFDNVVIHLSQEESIEIHNSILNHAVSAGALSAVFFYGSIILFLIKELNRAKLKKENNIYCMVVLNVLICGMFEPNIIWGQMMSSVIFWYSIARLRVE